MFHLNKDKLLFDLYIAFYAARKHKSKKDYVIKFEEKLHKNLVELRDELWNRTYKPSPYACFIVNHPKKREIFAAKFRDRIVHHLYFNYTHKLFENTFIYDSYACIKGKGTHFGIERLKQHIRQESNNYTEKCYILKMDIKGYFIHINRNILNSEILRVLKKMKSNKIDNKSNKTWEEVIDFDFIKFLTSEIALLDPTIDCEFKSKKDEWIGLPKTKSLFHTNKGCGLPIGNLTSQLFSNVFLNKFDQFVKRTLRCKHYGRYVDDFYIVSKDKEFLHKIIPQIEEFLEKELYLSINKGKTLILNSNYGVEFLGAFIKPHRTYISNASLRRIKRQIYTDKRDENKNPLCQINSFLGIFSHYKSFNLRKKIFQEIPEFYRYGHYNETFTKFIPNE